MKSIALLDFFVRHFIAFNTVCPYKLAVKSILALAVYAGNETTNEAKLTIVPNGYASSFKDDGAFVPIIASETAIDNLILCVGYFHSFI